MTVTLERRGHVALLQLSRPEQRNSWGDDMNDALVEALAELEADDAVRCLVVTGDPAGQAFCAGANLKDPRTHTEDSPGEFVTGIAKWRKFGVRQLGLFPKPTIAAVNGYAVGAGAILTFGCDLVVAATNAQWRLPQVALGVMPAYGGAVRLARRVGRNHAMKLALGFSLDAQEAYRIGLAQWLASEDDMMAKAMEAAEHIAGLPPLAARLAKESLDRGLDIPNLDDASFVDIYRFMALTLTEDSAEAHAAWRERRAAEVRGR